MGLFALGFLLLLFAGSCAPEWSEGTLPSDSPEGLSSADQEKRGCSLPTGLTTIEIDEIEVDLMVPEGKYQGDILVFPPWNESRKQWCKVSRLCSKASKKGFRVILPEMGKSIYAQTVYPETRDDWKPYPTLKWVREILIPELRINHCMLMPGGQNFVFGASSGARGAVLLAQDLPNLFVAVAALSGDYNPEKMKGDNIYRGFLGDYDAFPQRWETAENVLVGSSSIRSAMYLGHGKDDEVVAYDQTVSLYNTLLKSNPDLNVKLNIAEDRLGDFAYWSSELNNVFDFFEGTKAGNPEGASH